MKIKLGDIRPKATSFIAGLSTLKSVMEKNKELELLLEEKNKRIVELLESLIAYRASVPDHIKIEKIGANSDEDTMHEGYCNGWNDCVDAMRSKA